MSRSQQVLSRRRATMRVGFAAIIVMTALTACIFDQGDYQGGGRLDNGGSDQSSTASASASSSSSTDTDSSSPTDDSGLGVFLDANGQ